MTTIEKNIGKLELLTGAKFLHAFLECSDAIRTSIVEMLQIVNDSEVDDDDRDMALFTLADCLFPNLREGQLGMNLQESERLDSSWSGEARDVLAELDEEESTFAQALQAEMDRQGLTQDALAEKVGVGQSAISNMLLRQCRPQRRTIERFAEALRIPVESLWPGFKNS